MTQNFMAGAADYSNQSLQDIIDDINCWIKYSEKVKKDVEKIFENLKTTVFYDRIPCAYKIMITEISQICQTNIDDFKRTLKEIESQTLLHHTVEMFKKIGERAYRNGEDNKKYYKSNRDGYWHDYDNPEFKMVENIYKIFGDYCVTLWDVLNAAGRLKDYVNVPKEVTTVKVENKSINIGDGNQIINSNIGNDNNLDNIHISSGEEQKKEKWYSKFFWKLLIPIGISVIAAAMCVWLGIDQ